MGEGVITAISGIVTMGIGCSTLIAVVWMGRSFLCFSISLAITELLFRWAKLNDSESIEKVCRHWGDSEAILAELKEIKSKLDKKAEENV